MVNIDTIQLLRQALEKEYDDVKKYDKEDGIDIDSPDYSPDSIIEHCLKTFEDYRKIRMEEAYFSKMPNNLSSLQRQQKLVEYDHTRRNFHNAALSSVNILNRIFKHYKLTPIYNGNELTDEQIGNHTNLDARNAYTDFFLDLINQMENVTIDLIEQREASGQEQYSSQTIFSMSRQIRKDTRGYGLKEPFLHDDGDIVFDDDER